MRTGLGARGRLVRVDARHVRLKCVAPRSLEEPDQPCGHRLRGCARKYCSDPCKNLATYVRFQREGRPWGTRPRRRTVIKPCAAPIAGDWHRPCGRPTRFRWCSGACRYRAWYWRATRPQRAA